MKYSRMAVLGVALFAALALLACDPDQATLERGSKLNLDRIEGVVTGKARKVLCCDVTGTDMKKGDEYGCITIRRTDTGKSDEFCGVTDEIFNLVWVNMQLPNRVLTLKRLSQVRGTVIDKIPRPDIGMYFVVIDAGYGIEIYTAPIDVFYKNIQIGMSLPVDLAPQ